MNYILVSDPLFSFVVDSDIVPGYRTDHSGIIVKLKLQENDRGKGYWKFNKTLLKDKKYIGEVTRTIKEVQKTYILNNTEMENTTDDKIQFNINDQLFLETCLMIIRGNTIKYSSVKKRKKLEEENKLEEEIKVLEEEINNIFFKFSR